MTFEDAIQLILDSKITHLKVLDTEGKKLMDLHGDNADHVISQLQGYKTILASHGRLKFIAATESVFKQNWRDAYTWTIVFNSSLPAGTNTPTAIGAVPAGFVSQNEASLMARLEAMTMQMSFDKKFADLEKKLDEKKGDDFEKYLPYAGLFLDLDPKKLQAMTALAGMQSAMNGKQATGIAGPEQNNQVQTTVEEKEQIVALQNEMEKLAQKIPLTKIVEFIQVLNDKPQFLDSLIAMASAHKG